MSFPPDEEPAPVQTVICGGKLTCTVEEAALVLAKQEYPGLDPSPWIARLDAFAELVRPLLSERPDPPEIVGAINDVLFHDLGFRGNDEDYYDHCNSFLNDVLERRTGIPITLSIVYMAVARRVGLALRGTSFPGHFLVVHERSGWPIVIDAFDRGRILVQEDCAHLLARAGIGDWDLRYLESVPDLAILRRMLNNLRGIYLGAHDWPRLLRTEDQILVVTPEDHEERFTRALALVGCGATSEAIAEFETYLELRPQTEHRDTVLKLLAELRRGSP